MDYSTFQTTWADENGTFKNNTTRDIGEGDLRQFASDILGTFAVSASSSLVGQPYAIGDWGLSNSGASLTKQVYCGPSSNVAATKFFGVDLIADSDSILPRSKWTSPYFVFGQSGPALIHGSLFVFGASSVVNVSASGFFTSGTDFDTPSNYNRGYVTLFF